MAEKKDDVIEAPETTQPIKPAPKAEPFDPRSEEARNGGLKAPKK